MTGVTITLLDWSMFELGMMNSFSQIFMAGKTEVLLRLRGHQWKIGSMNIMAILAASGSDRVMLVLNIYIIFYIFVAAITEIRRFGRKQIIHIIGVRIMTISAIFFDRIMNMSFTRDRFLLFPNFRPLF